MPPLRALTENYTGDNGSIHVNVKLSLALERQSSAVFLQPATARVNTGASAAAASNITAAGLGNPFSIFPECSSCMDI